MAEERGLYKLTLLSKESEYLSWKRRVYAYLRRSDPNLLALSERPEEGSANLKPWIENSNESKE